MLIWTWVLIGTNFVSNLYPILLPAHSFEFRFYTYFKWLCFTSPWRKQQNNFFKCQKNVFKINNTETSHYVSVKSLFKQLIRIQLNHWEWSSRFAFLESRPFELLKGNFSLGPLIKHQEVYLYRITVVGEKNAKQKNAVK